MAIPHRREVLIHFLAAQDVRTPARLVEFLQRWYKSFPDFFQNTLQKSVDKLESMKARGEEIRAASAVNVIGKVLSDPKVFRKTQDGVAITLEKA